MSGPNGFASVATATATFDALVLPTLTVPAVSSVTGTGLPAILSGSGSSRTAASCARVANSGVTET